MRITIDFENWAEMEEFRTSGKKTRTKKEEADEVAAMPQPGGQPVMPATFSPPPASVSFPGANGATPPVNPLVGQIIGKLDGALASGQNPDQITAWFKNLLGPDAAAATLDQIKQVFIPRLPEPQLKNLAQQVGIAV